MSFLSACGRKEEERGQLLLQSCGKGTGSILYTAFCAVHPQMRQHGGGLYMGTQVFPKNGPENVGGGGLYMGKYGISWRS